MMRKLSEEWKSDKKGLVIKVDGEKLVFS
jgi:hypothetical protein